MPEIRARQVASALLSIVLAACGAPGLASGVAPALPGAGLAHPQDLQPAVPEQVGLSSARLERLSDLLSQYVEEERLAGAVALVARRGRLRGGAG